MGSRMNFVPELSYLGQVLFFDRNHRPKISYIIIHNSRSNCNRQITPIIYSLEIIYCMVSRIVLK